MGKLLQAVFDRALVRPWLLVPPLLGLLGQNVVALAAPSGPGSVIVRTVLSALMTSVVTAIFAELWLGDGLKIEPNRFVETGKLYLLPYPLLLIFGGLTAPLVYWIVRAEVPHEAAMAGLYGVLAIGKLSALALGTVSSLAVVHRSEAKGTWGALRRGFVSLGANIGFFVPALIGIWLFQEACVFLVGQLLPGVLGGFLTTAVPLFGCVALPIEAWRSGRLAKT